MITNFLFLGIVTFAVLLITACDKRSSEYKNFVVKYGSETRTFCDGSFKMRETFLSPEASAPSLSLINSQECKDTQTLGDKIKSRR